MAQGERVVYLNGQIIPESSAGISIRDWGFTMGDAVFDTARTFNGQVFKQGEHIDRLYDSCKYLRLDPGVTRDRMMELTTGGGGAQRASPWSQRGLLGDPACDPWPRSYASRPGVWSHGGHRLPALAPRQAGRVL